MSHHNQEHILWQPPQHHADVPHKSNHVAWIELFFDLIHVVCIFLLGSYLGHHHGLDGFLVFVGLFLMIWIAWGDTVFYTSLYVSNDVVHRCLMALQICTVMLGAAAIPQITGSGAVYFAVAYGLNRAILAYMYWRVQRNSPVGERCLSGEMARNFSLVSVAFLLSALLPAPWIYIAWGVALLLLQVGYVSSRVGIMRFERFVPRIEHLSERFALLMLIVLGEGFFKMVVTLADKGIDHVSADVLVNYMVGGFALFVLAWIYFDFVGNGQFKVEKRYVYRWWYAHVVLMLSAVMIGVAFTGEVKVGFWQPYPLEYAWIGCVGLALYLFCCWILQTCIEKRYVHDFYGWRLRAFGILMALICWVAVYYQVPALVGNLLFMIGLLSQVIVPMYRIHRHRNSNPSIEV